MRLGGNATSYVGAIYGLDGRRVRSFTAGASGRIVWDGRDEHGDLVRPGMYFLRAESGGRAAVARIAVIR